MEKIKVYELAQKLKKTSKEILDAAKKMNINLKSHLSNIEQNDISKIEEQLKKAKDKNNESKEIKENSKNKGMKKEKKEKKDVEKKPVIIRREVIIGDLEEKEKPKKPKRTNIGFVERKDNQNYNIVYRNKKQKPKNISELFGIKKDEKVQEFEEENQEDNIETLMKSSEEEAAVNLEENVLEQKDVKEVQSIKQEEKPKKQIYMVDLNSSYKNDDEKRQAKKNNYTNQNREQKEQYSNNRNIRYNNNNNNNTNNRGFQNRVNPNNKTQFQNKNNRFRNNGNTQNNFNGQNRNNQSTEFKRGNYKPGFRLEENKEDISQVVKKDTQKAYLNKKDNKFNNKNFDEKKKKNSRKNSDEDFDTRKIKDLKSQANLSNMFDDQDGGMLDYYDLTTTRGKRNKKIKKDNEESKQKIFKLANISIPETISVKDLAAELKKTSSDIIKKLLEFGTMATINQEIDFDTAFLISQEFGVTANKIETKTEEDILFDNSEDKAEDLVERPPVVVVMGHVDHGKTSLLDAIKKTNVIEGEAGGITQHIGAYKVKIGDKAITFLDTPGHEAFTAMRARGAQITDIAILVVAANDGVMPQTIEAINHAKAAGIPIIVAINKIDLPDANVEKVKEELMRYELVPEEWGGDTIYVPISAKNHLNIDQLLEMILLQAEMLELKVNPNKQAKGVIIESRLDKNKGPVATLLVQRGTLDVGDTIVVGQSIGHIRTMINDKGKLIKSAGPSTPVSISGLSSVPEGGDTFYEVDNEKMAKHLIERRIRTAREKKIKEQNVVTIENFYEKMKEEEFKVLNLIVKADVQGSVEALKQSLEKIKNEEVIVKVIHSAAGAVNQSDVTLAKVSNAIIIAFNVRPDSVAQDIAKKDSVEIKQYSVIYQAIEDIENAIKGMLAPKFEEKVIGNMEVRETFKMSTVGTIGGCFVLSGKVERNANVRVIRENIVIHDGKLSSLKRFKDDAREVSKGFECGITIENYNDIKQGDNIEVYVMEEVKR